MIIKGKFYNILLLIISVVAGIFISEILLRGFLKIKYQSKESLPYTRIYPYPGLAYDLQPCKSNECIIKINSLGLRGREINKEKGEGTIRITIIGDSATFGAKVELDEETIPGRLQKRLEEGDILPNKRFEVINGGIPGYDIQEIYLHYKYKLKALKSDIVIYNFYSNDFLNSKFTVEKIGGKPTLVRFISPETPGLQFLSFLPDRLNIALNEYSLLYRYTIFYISQLFIKDPYEISKYLGGYKATNVKYLDLLYEEIKRNNSFFIASSEIYSYCAKCREPLKKTDCPDDKGCKWEYELIKRLERYMRDKQIPFINLSDTVADMDLREIMVDATGHYSAKANVIMADKLYEFVKPYIINIAQ